MPSLRTLARSALVATAIAVALPAPAQDIGSTIVLPDRPFVLPVLSGYVFPADPRSGDVLTQRANNNRDSATYVLGVNSTTVRDFRRIGSMPTSASCPSFPGDHKDGSAVYTQPLYAGSATLLALYSLNGSNGAGTLLTDVSGTRSNFWGLAPDVVTPLPSALPLFATGLAGLGLLGWHRKRKARAVAA